MFSVYLLQSLHNPTKSYVGLTIKPVEERLKQHNSGLSQSTKQSLPWKVVYFEQFYCKLCADKREQFLKSGKGYKIRKMILNHQDEF